MLKRLAAWLFLVLSVAGAPAQTIHPPINTPVFRAFDANGAPLAGGKLYSYAAGSSTPLATYADALNVAPNTNPVVLDATGQAKIFLSAANYKFILQDANGVQQWSVDNINGAPTATGVTSVFGRTGVVVAVSGDYTCAQITGAVCAQPVLYYQQVSTGGATLAQEPILNLIPGTGTSISCVDNTGTTATDCTFGLSGTPTARTCNANGCYLIQADGTIIQWGTTGSCGGGANSCSVSVTFPVAFTTTANLAVLTNVQHAVTGADGNAIAMVNGAPTLTGFSNYFAALVYVGGAGVNLTGLQVANWIAVGH